MRIYPTDWNSWDAAGHLDDRRLIRACLVTAQIISTAIRKISKGKLSAELEEVLYKSVDPENPWVVWCCENSANFLWMWGYGRDVDDVYFSRFNKWHKCHKFWNGLEAEFDTGMLNITKTKNPSLFPDLAKDKKFDFTGFLHPVLKHPNLVLGYRAFLNAKWLTDPVEPKWTNSDKPNFYLEDLRLL